MVEFVIYCALIENLLRQLFTNLKNNLVRQYDSMYIQLVNVVFQDGDNFCKAFAKVSSYVSDNQHGTLYLLIKTKTVREYVY